MCKFKDNKKEYDKKYRLENKDKIKKTQKRKYRKYKEKYRIRNKKYAEKNKERYRQWRIDNKDKIKDLGLRNKYNMTLKQFNELLVLQDNKCGCCESIFKGKRLPCVDHNHKTGENRGLLCTQCNTSLGLLKEDKSKILKLITYIEKWSNGGD